MTFDWNYMLGLLGDAEFWRATWTVIKLSTLTWVLSIGFGFLLALAKQSRHALLSVPARGYIWLFRSLPLLFVQRLQIHVCVPLSSFVLDFIRRIPTWNAYQIFSPESCPPASSARSTFWYPPAP